jgi:protoporphyrinogen oxidase
MHREEVLNFLFQFMAQDEWKLYDRVSKIRLRGTEVDHPLEAHLWQFPREVQVDYLDSLAQAGCVRGELMPESFAEWIAWKFGEQIAKDYMLPYNRKIWSMDLDKLGTYWLYKLPDVSFRETLRSCLERRATGSLPAHGRFLYPKIYGYGEVWRRMGEALGDCLKTNCPVENIDLETRTINHRWQAETIVSTIPWTLWHHYCDMPESIVSAISRLKYASIIVDYYPETLANPSHWIYEPDESIPHHRILLRSNFIPGACGFWTETNALRAQASSDIRFHNEFAYPINTRGKPKAVEQILTWARSHGIAGMGRWGRWEHMNSDIAVAKALAMADRLKEGL